MGVPQMCCAVFALLAWAPVAETQVAPPDWVERLSARLRQSDARQTIVDQVVLVMDEREFINEIARWTPERRWPVLFKDDVYAPMFIRRFQPRAVLLSESRSEPKLPPEDLKQRFEEALLRSWGGDPRRDTLARRFAERGHAPAGAVFASSRDPAWPAALALAAGRGQPILWLEDDFGRINQPMDRLTAERMLARQIDLLRQAGWSFDALGDDIETLTMCRSMSPRVEVGVDAAGEKDHRAVTDMMGRLPDGSRFAIAGWIFGDEVRSTYAAMCSLFLPREHAALANTYPVDQGSWGAYDTAPAGAALQQSGWQVSGYGGREMTAQAWVARLPGGLSGDVLLMNTKGNAAFFEMFGGERCYSVDVPVLTEPMAVHFIHSWSAMQPGGGATVGGRFLEHGAYAYVGSVQEPGLGGFVRPREVADRLIAGVPFLIAARHWGATVWRINTHGDPLMTCGPRSGARIEGEPRDRLIDLREQLKDLLREAESSRSAAKFAEAVRLAHLLGEDQIAFRTWQHARERRLEGDASRWVLPALFRLRRSADFLDAWDMTLQPTDLDRDMLWHLLTPRLGGNVDERLLTTLRNNIRGPMTHADLARLAPVLRAAFGAAYVNTLIDRELANTNNPMNRRELERLKRGR